MLATFETLESRRVETNCRPVRTFQVRYVKWGKCATTQRWSIDGRKADDSHTDTVKEIKDRFEKDCWFLALVCFTVSLSVETVQATPVWGAVNESLASLCVCVCVFRLPELLLAIARVTCVHGITWPKVGHCTHRL